MKEISIFVFAGEASGDLHGENIINALRKNYPKARLFGVGGPKMRSAGLECILPMEKFQVMGFIDVFFALPRIFRQFFFLRSFLLKEKPDLVFLIDYPGFNLLLANSLFKRSFKGKICQYICPSVWAWGKQRIAKMEKILDRLFVIFPFEETLFNREKLQVRYVGNPLVQNIAKSSTPALDIDGEYRVVGIFPGSRQKELVRNFPKQLFVAKKLLQKHTDLFFVISIAQPNFSVILEEMMRAQEFPRDRILFLEASQNKALMKRITLAIAKSGTNNLELALHHVPTIVTYGIGSIDFFIAKNLLRIRLPFYCIVNIIANKQVFPELIGPHFTEEALLANADHFLSSKETMEECRKKCQEIGNILQNKVPDQEILKELNNLLYE